MRKIASLAGPAAATIAFKCPFCLFALAGLGAGAGSLATTIQGLYWGVILSLGGTFLWFLFGRWKSSALPGWVVGLGLVGFGSLVYQVATEAGGIFSLIPMITLTATSIASFFWRKSVPCGACRAQGSSKNEDEKMSLNLSPREGVTIAHKEENDMAKRKVEIFTAGCPVCEPAVELVKKVACPSCEVVVYDLNAGCATNECHDKAKQYGITRVPAVVVDGNLLDCCKTGSVTEKELRSAGVGSA